MDAKQKRMTRNAAIASTTNAASTSAANSTSAVSPSATAAAAAVAAATVAANATQLPGSVAAVALNVAPPASTSAGGANTAALAVGKSKEDHELQHVASMDVIGTSNGDTMTSAAGSEASATSVNAAAAVAAAAAASATGSFASMLGERKRDRDSDSEGAEGDENDDDDDNDDETSQMLAIGEDEGALVQCPPLDNCFDSWEQFHRAMADYCVATHQPMRLRTSDSARALNIRNAKRNSAKEPIDESVGFVKKLYACTHGVKTKPRGKGKRPRQHYRYMGCPAMLRACIAERNQGEGISKDKYVVRVTAQINKHNHRLSEHLFKSYSESRVVVDDELVVKAGGVPAVGGKPKDETNPVIEYATPPAAPVEDTSFKTNPLFQAQPLDLIGATQKIRVGWIGVGIMGNSMCSHLLNNGYEVTVYNRTLSKCNSLRDKGARVASSPAEVAHYSEIVFVMVGYPSDVRSVILDPTIGVLARMKVGGVIVDMTTSEPSLAREIYEVAKTKGVLTLDAPVSGGDIGAREATLSIMVGGEVDAVYVAMPFFNLMGKNIRHMGGPGAGQHTKMVNQILIATSMVGVVEGLLYAKRSGLDMNEAIRAVSAGAAGSWSISNLGPRIAKRDFEPGFFVEHFLKDLGIALKEAERMGLALPGLALANQLYIALKAQGHARSGTQALMLALEQLNGIHEDNVIKNIEVV